MKRATIAVGMVLLVGLVVGSTGQTLDGLAELHVQKIVLDPPSAVVRGEDVVIYTRITNTGGRSADHFAVGFYYRPARLGEPWIPLGTLQQEHLRPSQQDFLEATYTLETLEMEFGAYEIRVVADVSNQIPEIDELNNELITSMALVASTLGLPELQPTGITFEKLASPDAGKWEITVDVANLGEDAQSFFKVQFFLGDDPFDPSIGESAANTKVVPGSGQAVAVTGTLNPVGRNLEPGTYEVTAVIDADGQVAEQDEGNNRISAWLTVNPVEIHPISLAFDRPVARLDEDLKVTSAIVNSGQGIAKNVNVAFLINGLRFGLVQIPQLGTDAKEVSATLNADRLGLADAPKVYEISVIVDPEDALRESDEANNEMLRTLTILPPQPKMAEIHPESLILSPASPVERSPANDSRGHNTVTVSSVVRNTGRASTGPFHADFAYRVKGSQRWTPFGCDGTQVCPPVELEAGTDTTLVRTLDVRQLPTGIYEIRVKADSDMAVDELDEQNNELVTTLTLLSSRLADLSVGAPLTVTPSNQVKQGQGIDLAIAVTNQGDLAAGPFEVSLSYCKMVWGATPEETVNCAVDGQFVPVATETVLGGLAIGEQAVVEFEMETVNLNPGQYFLRVDLDAGGDVPERNELDNILSTIVLVQGPDLVAQGIQAEWGPVDRDEDGQMDGEAVHVTAQLSNIGILPAGDFVIGFYYAKVESGTEPTATCLGSSAVPCELSGEFGMIPMEGLDVGAPPPTRIVGCRWDPELLGLGPGTYILGVFVDAEDTVREHNELNNRAEIPFELPAPPEAADLAALWLEADLVPLDENEDGIVDREVVDVAVRLGNIGIVPAGDFVIEFYYVPVEPGTQGEVTCADDPETLCEPGPVFGTVELLGLDVGAEVTARCRLEPDRLVLAKPGAYVLGATIDAGDWVFEQDEENNRAELLFILPGPPDGGTPTATGADLVALSLFARRSSSDPDDLRAWATIGNHGIHDVGPFEVAFYYTPENHPDPVFSVANVPGLAAGATVTLLRTFDITGLAAGHYLVGVIADPEDLLHEPNEENNAQETRLRLY